MTTNHVRKVVDMLGGADAAGEAAGGGGRIELIDTVKALRGRLPGPIQRWLPDDLPSVLLLLAYAWTTFIGVGLVYVGVTGWQTYPGAVVLVIPILVVGLAGLWRPRTLWTLIPAGLVWLGLVVVSLLTTPPVLLTAATFTASVVVAIWSAMRRARDSRRQVRAAEQTTNQLGWDLYRLSQQPPVTDEALAQIGVYRDLRMGELQRHFDQVTTAAIQGGMQHVFRLRGTSSSIHGLPQFPLLRDTQTWMSLDGSGRSSVQLGMSGTTTDQLTGEAFVVVFERTGPEGIDTIRAVVPSERQARTYVDQLMAFWSAGLGPTSKQQVMLRRYAGAISQAVTSDSSYVADRLSAILRLPAQERPAVTVIGEQLNQHTVLVGAVRFGSTGPLFQLFPIALVRAILALIQGLPLPPQPPAGLTPTIRTTESTTESEGVEPAVATSANGHIAALNIRTLGGLRLTAGPEDITSALLDRKVLAFLWLHLLARNLRNTHDTITRASLADELSPGLDTATQRSRLRGRLSELRNQLPPALGRRVQVAGERISLDLADCAIDFQRVIEAATKHRSSNGMLSAEELKELSSLLAGAEGTFLPDWDDLEHHVNGGRGGAGEVVSDLRRKAEVALGGLLRTLGTSFLAHGNAEAAVAPLERALQISPDDEAVARTLVAACAQTGRLSRAEEVRKEFSLA
jgi:DNA-binding SARP family transcriptional activator